MPVSPRFMALLGCQLSQFADCPDVRSLVVYVAHQGREGQPSLLPVGRWPLDGLALPPVDTASELRVPADGRRWLPLRHDRVLLGALQVEVTTTPWPEPLRQRLQATALALTEALRLDLDLQALDNQLQQRDEQLRLLVHQLRNPLTALRTFGQLLRRRLEHDHDNRPLAEGVLAEERQLNRYVDALSALAQPTPQLAGGAGPLPLLLPPLLSGPSGQPLAEPLAPLLHRAAATATLQQRRWQAPASLPEWRGDSGAVAEILANLLENAFRYSPPGSPLGLHWHSDGDRLLITVWDGGEPIDDKERQRIFERGVRGRQGQHRPGTGLGLALGRDLARSLGGDLKLVVPPSRLAPELPASGNAFCLALPLAPALSPSAGA
ncbi:MAG: HAMP domain-containing sensor histidine kinase [Cyanobacteriota bacterium]|nr:HAMP domain-containing sensor histidine kinase [Cyanobacteriota bacterium]